MERWEERVHASQEKSEDFSVETRRFRGSVMRARGSRSPGPAQEPGLLTALHESFVSHVPVPYDIQVSNKSGCFPLCTSGLISS